MYPYANPSLISRGLSLLKTIKWGEFIDGTQKTLGVINQAIPIVYQVKPIVNNAKTLFKIANVVNSNTPTQSNQQSNINSMNNNTSSNISNNHNNSPIFYI